MSDASKSTQIMVTGATGFVGRQIVRELLARGFTPVCLIRSPEKLFAQHPEVNPDRLVPVLGSLSDATALRTAAELSQAAIHLVGIILSRPLRGQTFHGIHVKGTNRVVDAVNRAGIRRFVHMSALGTRPNAVSAYHQTKWQAEEYVRKSGLDWTIFRPSIIHGPEGDYMRLMKRFMCSWLPPAAPYFGSGNARVQPVFVKDVAYCFVQSLFEPASIGKVIPLGGPQAYSWLELYAACRDNIPCAKRWKPFISQPVAAAKFAAIVGRPFMALAEMIARPLGLFRFDAGQVDMSQEDSVCDQSLAEQMFHMKFRDFEEELALYADQIR